MYQTILFERTKCHRPNWGAMYEHHINLVVQILFKMGIMGKKMYCKACMTIFFIVRKEHKSLLNLLIWWKQRVVIFYEYKNKVDFDGTPN